MITMVNFEIKGIGKDTETARFKPADSVTITTAELSGQTAGKLFVAIRDFNPDVPNAFGLIFNGQQVDVRENETYMQTNTEDQPDNGYKTYAFDVPMRFLHGAPKPATYTIQFMLGSIQNKKFSQESLSGIYTLVVPSDDLLPGTTE